jgi:APA family basic amino acid/polyamine antiporter
MNIKRYFTRKSISQLIKDSNASGELERTLDAFQLVLFGIGAIIGAGVFVFTGTAAANHTGPALMLSFAFAGAACCCAGLCYAELASILPIAGSSYTYAYATLGELPAWLMSGMIFLTYALGGASVAGGWSGYVVSFLEDYGLNIFPPHLCYSYGKVITLADGSMVTSLFDLPAFLITLALTILVFRGTETSAKFNAFMVAVKMVVIFGFIALGATKVDPSNWVPLIPENEGVIGKFGWSGVLAGTSIVFLSFGGFDAVASTAQETKNPQRDLPIGILVSILIATITYIAMAAVMTGLAHYTTLGVAKPVAVAVDKLGMPWFSSVIKIGAISGLTTALLVIVFLLVRVLFVMSHDGLLPKAFGKTHPKYHSPHISTFIVGLMIAVLSATVDLNKLVAMGNFGALTTFGTVCAITIYLRYKEPKLKRDFKCPLMPWVPLFGAVTCFVILLTLPADVILYSLLWTLGITVIYFLYSRHHSKFLKTLKS